MPTILGRHTIRTDELRSDLFENIVQKFLEVSMLLYFHKRAQGLVHFTSPRIYPWSVKRELQIRKSIISWVLGTIRKN